MNSALATETMAKTTVYYTKLFKSGTLKGLTVDCEVSFATKESAFEFASKIRPTVPAKTHKDVLTNTKWECVDLSFQKYSRR